MTPSHIGQYRIVRKIGAGGMGLVFLGEHTLLGRRAAIKTLLPTIAADHEIVERFFNEARATSAISDPGVIQVFDFGYHVDGTAYIVMELLEGEALSARIDRLGRLSLADALRIARQVAGSLAVAHSHGIVHRDLKPDNIFLVADSEAEGGERTKILDFGICKIGSTALDAALTQTGAMVGTPVYMSPEQCRGAGGVDQRSDIYALGCLMFHMLTGRPPFLREAAGELIVAHMHEAPPAPSTFVTRLPLGVDALLLTCLAKAPGDRFQSMADVQQALGELHLELDLKAAAVTAVTPAVPLGRGFRSVYNVNLTARTGRFRRSRVTPSRMPQLAFSPSSSSAPSPDDSDIRPARRSKLRAALTGVLVAGAAVGIGGTAAVLYGAYDDGGYDPGDSTPAMVAASASDSARFGSGPEAQRLEVSRGTTPEGPMPAQALPAATPVTRADATTTNGPAEGDPTAGPAAPDEPQAASNEGAAEAAATAPDATTTAAPIEHTVPARRSPVSERLRRLRESSRERTKDKPVIATRPRAPAPVPPMVPLGPASPSGLSGPVVSPAPVTSPASAPAEDLYDTR